MHLGNRTRCQGNPRREPKQRSHERLGEYAFYEYFRYCGYKATERYLNVLFTVLLAVLFLGLFVSLVSEDTISTWKQSDV